MATNITQSERDKNWEEYKRRSASRKKTVKMDWGDKPASKTTREIAEQAQREASAPAPAVVNKNADIAKYISSGANIENMSLADIRLAAKKAQAEQDKVRSSVMTDNSANAAKITAQGKAETNMKTSAISSLKTQKEAEKASTPVARGAEALSSIVKKTGASLGILAKGGADAIGDAVANKKNAEYQKEKERRAVLEERLANTAYDINADEGIEAPGGEAVTTQAILRNAIEKAKEKEDKLKQETVIDENHWAMKLYESGLKDAEKAKEGLTDTQKQAFDIGMSIADNLTTLPTAMVNPSLPLQIMAAKAAAGKTYELSKQGVAAKEAILRGAVSGGIEAMTEKIPLDEVLDAIKIGGRPFIKSVLQQMGTEATEESISYMLNHIADVAAQDPNAQFSLKELAMSALSGAASGGIMASGAAAIGNAGRALRNNANTLQAAENNDIIKENNIREAEYAGEENNGQRDERAFGTFTQKTDTYRGGNDEVQRAVSSVRENKTIYVGPTGRITDTSFGEKHISKLNDSDIVTAKVGSAADEVQQIAAANGFPCFVVSENTWKTKYPNKKAAFVSNGQIYIREDMPQKYKDMIIPHEATHVMKQKGYEPYLDFVERVPEFLNTSSEEYQILMEGTAEHCGMDLLDMTLEESARLYDEINSLIFGSVASGDTEGIALVRDAFKDFDSYAAQLSDIHRQFKESQNNAVNTETAAENAESNINPSGSKQKPKTKTVSRAERYIKKQEKAFFEKVSKIFGQEMPVGYTDDIISNIKARMQDGRYISREDTEILFKETADLMGQTYIDNTESVSKPESFQIGDKVSPTDRNNMGTIVGLPNEENGDKYTVYFYNTQKGTEAEVEFSYEQLNPYMSKTESLGVDELNDTGRSNYENDLYEFSKALDKFSTEYAEAREYIVNDTTPEETNAKIAEFKTLYENIRRLEKKEKAAERKASLKQDEKNIVEGLLKGTQKFEDIPPKYNINGILEVYDAKKAVAENRKGIKEFNKHRKFELRAMAADHLDELWKWKDKPAGFLYKRETMERIFRDIIPDKDVAESMIADYITPVHKNTANANRLKNTTRKTIKELNLSDKKNHYVEYMNGNDAVAEAVSERTLVQLLGEGKINDADVTKSGADLQKIKNAVNVFRSVYNGLIDQMNDVLMRNGYKPVEYRKDYFPHFEADKPDTLFQKAAARIGMKIKSDKLPTSIAGLTHTFRPGKPHFGHAMQRTGVRTEYDAVKGFDSYIEGIADVIYHTDDIQKLRALENEIRYETSEESVREEIDKIMRDSSLDIASQQTALDEVYRRDKTHLSNLAVQLREYTDNLANKKSIDDRTIEHMVGRGFYDGVKQLESRFSANMVGQNIRANLTNFIPISQAISNLNTTDVIRSMAISMKNLFKDDGFTDKSTFLTNREGSDILSKTALQKGVDNASKLLSWIDTFTSNVIVRAKYMENLRGGMDEGSAMDNADDFAASVIADRSKGALPTIFNSKNPLIKAFTAFQVEVNNQVSYYTKDIPRLSKEEKKKYLWGMTKTAVASYLINLWFDWMFGDTPAFDPIGLALDFAEDVRDEDQTTYEAILNLGDAVIEDVPFVGSWFGGGRVPFASALPEKDNLKTIFNPKTPENKRKELALKETGKVLTNIVMPAGGAQLRKTAEGLTSYAQKGSYTYNNKGEKIMRFPVEQNAGNAVRSALFGQYATKEGKEYVDGGFEKFTADKTEKIERLGEENNIDRAESVRVLKELSGIKREEDKRQYIYDLPWTKDDKQKLHGMIFDSKTSIDYSNENSFKITNAFKSDDERKNAENAVRLGVNVDKVIEFFDEQKDIKGIKFQGKTVKNSRRKAVERICERYAKNEEQFITLMRLAGFTSYDSELYALRKVPS